MHHKARSIFTALPVVEARKDDLQAQVQATEKLKADYAASETHSIYTELAKAEARALHVQGEYSNRICIEF
jgi:hypothetical protein